MSARPFKVLLASSSPSAEAQARELLAVVTGGDFVLESVAGYDAALARIRPAEHDVYLFDYWLDERSGLELLRDAMAGGCRAPTIFVAVDDSPGETPVGQAGGPANGELHRFIVERSLRFCYERIRNDAALRASQATLELVTGQIPAILWTTDDRLRLTSLLGAGLEEYDLDPARDVGKDLFQLFGTEDPDIPPIAAHSRALRGESVAYDATAGMKHHEVRVEPLRDPSGRISGCIRMALDVTQRKLLEEQLRHAQKLDAIGALAGGVAHEFNNLLAVVVGYSELLLRRTPDEATLRAHVEQIRRAADRGAQLTRQILAFGRKQVLSPREVELGELVGSVVALLRRLIGEGIELLLSTPPELWTVTADAGQLEDVLVNLALNARDAMPTGGRLEVSLGNLELAAVDPRRPAELPAGAYVMLAVRDTGCGMSPETQSRIFEPFFTTKEVGEGTGLGLSTVYGVVKQSGGHIEVESALGAGTTFRIYLPRGKGPGKATPVPGATAVPAHREATILLVEDEDLVRSLVREVLHLNGYTLLEADNAANALRVGEGHQGRIDLLLTDVVMPGISGPQLARQLAGSRPELKVLYMSGYTDDAVIGYGVGVAETAFLRKPFTPTALAEKVREVLG